MAQIQLYVGIDISKDRLDIHIHPTGEAFPLPYDGPGIAALLARRDLDQAILGCEATGGYEDRLLVALSEAGRPAFCLHPADIRAFARLKGRRAKTDQLDARAIAEALPAAASGRAPLRRSREQSELRELLVLRRSLMAMVTELKGHRARMRSQPAGAAIETTLAALQLRLKHLLLAISKGSDADPRAARIRSAPGAGPLLAAEIVAFLPEIGTASSRRIASLVGVAPHPRRSGNTNLPGRCQGGRASLRRVLYMATLSALKARLAPLYPFYARLRAAGKSFKIAIVAAMRKLIVILNAMIRDQQDWTPKIAT